MNTCPKNTKPLGADRQPRGGYFENGKMGGIHLTPASHTLKTAILCAGRSGHMPGWAVPVLLRSIGRKPSPAKARALCWCLSLAVNANRIRGMEAERAARALGGWS